MPRLKVTEPINEVSATASSLMDTAERLFARDGIENVSIRQIVMASGHGNLSGAHYHFGSREVLIRKVLERRMVVVDAMRHETLDRLIQQGRDQNLFAIIEETVRVLETAVRSLPWGRDYIVVIAQALFSPRVHLLSTINTDSLSGLQRTGEMAYVLLPHLPRKVFEERMRIVRQHATYEMAHWLQENELNAATEAAFEEMMVTMTEFAVGGLMAPTRLTAQTPAQPAPPPASRKTARKPVKGSSVPGGQKLIHLTNP